jgi:hypothetical protein
VLGDLDDGRPLPLQELREGEARQARALKTSMPSREPKYETRWRVGTTRFHFSEERLARAFALPGQIVTPFKRRVLDPDDTLEFLFPNDQPYEPLIRWVER